MPVERGRRQRTSAGSTPRENSGLQISDEAPRTGGKIVSWQQFDSAAPVNDTVWWAPENATTPPEFSLDFARYENPDVGAALAQLRENEDPAIQREAMGTVQRLMGADVPYLWLHHAQFAIIATPKLVNVTRSTLPDGAPGLGLHRGAHPLHQVWLTDQVARGPTTDRSLRSIIRDRRPVVGHRGHPDPLERATRHLAGIGRRARTGERSGPTPTPSSTASGW